ncbi:MAG: thiamine phosphate synthase [Nitrospirae bacterium]|nr:thiamine phosphate synthase [Nitrospirota bacterium]
MDFKLYLITDRTLTPDIAKSVESALKGGCRAIQLREKDMNTKKLLELAQRLRELTLKYGARLFINDRLDIAISIDADGIHLGQKSMPLKAVKKLSDKLLIGVSTHSLKEALGAENEGADFITLGPVYETLSKLAYGKPIGVRTFKYIRSKVKIPVLAIGGIKLHNLKEVMKAGADGVSVISGLLSSANIKTKTEEYMRLLYDKN